MENKEIMKPASMVINEFKIKIEEAINTSGLPPVVMEPILNNYLLQLQIAAKQQTLSEIQQYEASLEKKEEQDD